MRTKKIFLGFAILGVYGIYSIGIRHQYPTIIKPKIVATKTTKTTSTNAAKATTSTSNSQPPATSPPPSAPKPSSGLNDGSYTGSVADAYYGNVQVKIVVSGGRLTDVVFLQYPNEHPTSVYINQQAMPYLKQEAIKSQSSNVQIISGATFTSEAYVQSLRNALKQA